MELDIKNDYDEVKRSKRDHVLIDESDVDKYKLIEKKLPFKNHLHTFTVATLIGYYCVGSSKSIEKSYNGFVHLSVFRNSPCLDFLKTFAIVHENDPLVLVDEKRLFDLCEGYARTGIDQLIQWADSKDEDLENIIAKVIIEKFNELNVD
ncbi:hypothetical protein [uncultured Methanobrevibacter sp.]|uniref:hypothetical protein n=1 Tax=uncultured Methanobrevibacter sp. TaxID=253161 RepID=UPI00262E8EE4|nr:hypothetical protein [uncultured Methanobrevibacter sp.]